MRRSKKTSKLRVTGLCEGNSPVTGEFPTQRASNAEDVFIWWRLHECVSVNKLPALRFQAFLRKNTWQQLTLQVPVCEQDRTWSSLCLHLRCYAIGSHCTDYNQLVPPSDKMAAILADDTFKYFFLNEKCRIPIQISPKFVPMIQLIISQHWFSWWLGTEQATIHYLNPVHWRIYATLGEMSWAVRSVSFQVANITNIFNCLSATSWRNRNT